MNLAALQASNENIKSIPNNSNQSGSAALSCGRGIAWSATDVQKYPPSTTTFRYSWELVSENPIKIRHAVNDDSSYSHIEPLIEAAERFLQHDLENPHCNRIQYCQEDKAGQEKTLTWLKCIASNGAQTNAGRTQTATIKEGQLGNPTSNCLSQIEFAGRLYKYSGNGDEFLVSDMSSGQKVVGSLTRTADSSSIQKLAGWARCHLAAAKGSSRDSPTSNCPTTFSGDDTSAGPWVWKKTGNTSASLLNPYGNEYATSSLEDLASGKVDMGASINQRAQLQEWAGCHIAAQKRSAVLARSGATGMQTAKTTTEARSTQSELKAGSASDVIGQRTNRKNVFNPGDTQTPSSQSASSGRAGKNESRANAYASKDATHCVEVVPKGFKGCTYSRCLHNACGLEKISVWWKGGGGGGGLVDLAPGRNWPVNSIFDNGEAVNFTACSWDKSAPHGPQRNPCHY